MKKFDLFLWLLIYREKVGWLCLSMTILVVFDSLVGHFFRAVR